MQKGQSLIELLLTIALVSFFFPALLTGFVSTRNNRAVRDQRQLATAYLNEGQEAIRVIRTNGWSNLSAGTYHPTVSGSTWILTSGPELIDGNFTRQIIIGDVKRDSNGNIAQDGTLDPSTKLITISVSWNSPFPNSVSVKSYLTRHDSNIHTDTTIADFTPGLSNPSTAGIALTNTGGGEITLLGAGGGKGDWCKPNLSIAALDLPKNGVANAVTAIEGRAFAGTGDNASGESFANINITNADPPATSILGTFSNYKTNDVFGEAGYGYIATDTNSKEIVIVNFSSNPYTEAGYFNASGITDANSVFVVGNTGYMTQGSRLRNFDLSSKSGSRPAIDSDGIELSATGTSVYVSGNYAFVSIAGHAKELEIVDVSNPSNLQVIGYADVNGQAAYDAFVNSTGTRAYLATGSSSSQKEFFIVDVSTKTGSRPTVGSYDANGMDPNAVTVVTNNKAILVGTGTEEYQVINITDETQPARCGGLNVDSGINGLASVLEGDGDAYTYIITGDSSSEFKIIEGGPGEQFVTNGVYDSTVFDAGANVMFNGFSVNHIVPTSTSIQYEVAVATAVNNSCLSAIFSYSGPYATSSALPSTTSNPAYKNPGRCLKYKAVLSTTDPTQSPILYDINFNYSP